MKYLQAFVLIVLLASLFFIFTYLLDIKQLLIPSPLAHYISHVQSLNNGTGDDILHVWTINNGTGAAYNNATDVNDGDPFSYLSLDKSKVLDLRCSQCALVSASGQLLHSGAGAEIDAIPCVVRMNDSPTVKYEKDVGSRTTLRFMAHSAVKNVNISVETLLQGAGKPKYIVVWGPPKEMERSGRGIVFNYISKMQKANPDIGFYVLENEQYEYAEHVFQTETGKSRYTSGSWLSTGLFTMVLLRKICDSIIIYGMVDSTYCVQHARSSVPYHYYAPNGTKECSLYMRHEKAKKQGHRFLTEKYIFMSWGLTTYNITFRYPSSSVKTISELRKTTFLKT